MYELQAHEANSSTSYKHNPQISISRVSIRIVVPPRNEMHNDASLSSHAQCHQRSFKRSPEPPAPPRMKTLLVLPVLPRSTKSCTGRFAAARLVERLVERLSLLLLLLPSLLSSSFIALFRLLLLTVRACFIIPSIHSNLSPVRSTFFAFGPASPTSVPCQEF